MAKKVLDVGGGNRELGIPDQYDGWKRIILDVNPNVKPDILLDARLIASLEPGQYDCVHCSHVLEHIHRHELPKVLLGFANVLKPDGFVDIRVPDLEQAFKAALEYPTQLDTVMYIVKGGGVTVHDMIYGYTPALSEGNALYIHKTGFTRRNLLDTIYATGLYKPVYIGNQNLELRLLAFKREPSQKIRELFKLPDAEEGHAASDQADVHR